MGSEGAALAGLAAFGVGGQDQNLPPDKNQGPLLDRVVWVNLAISGVFLVARLWTKWRKTHRLYWDDGLIVLAWLVGLVHAAQITTAVTHGLGRHMQYLSTDQREQTIRLGVLSLLSSFLSPMIGRIAFLVTVYYLAGTDKRVKRWPVILFVAGQLLVNISAIIVFYTQCGSDLELLWGALSSATNLAEHYAKCSNPVLQTDYGYFQGSFNTVTDAFLTLMPAVLIQHTSRSLKTKIGLAFLLCLSAMYEIQKPPLSHTMLISHSSAMIASIVKTYYSKALSEPLDYTYDLVPLVIWISIELNVVIIVSSLPLMRPIFTRRRPRRATEDQPTPIWGSSTTFGSFMAKKGARSTLARVDSEEAIMPQNAVPMRDLGAGGINVTREISVTYESSNQPFVHAALVGLIEGEIANPKLARR
ncbi:hypothetical protein LTR35_004374 [Friedmanniomyces endolithicus]|uniref:Rhodopsin domain-containing protein n=1 Tax=Friedmanniomyces endolithicus TaxID=329885 RepID=A0AAN6FY24_9PEZI|nr:hypothetical protein LTR35_004374 [Friedmanniomyces endolithicus]KAK0295500.1 hypothetical protein LTS00_005700 [Friedmanniomyces endolithicus]KAK0326539.1 hypothetical protein LTR82_002381 [Friedmanniomyces endolithicus]KAK1017490.1 hypothetical protein LTR54_002148 [Friedmanniomyces endolithicus]